MECQKYIKICLKWLFFTTRYEKMKPQMRSKRWRSNFLSLLEPNGSVFLPAKRSSIYASLGFHTVPGVRTKGCFNKVTGMRSWRRRGLWCLSWENPWESCFNLGGMPNPKKNADWKVVSLWMFFRCLLGWSFNYWKAPETTRTLHKPKGTHKTEGPKNFKQLSQHAIKPEQS